MALIQKLQRGKAIPGGANKVSSIKDFDSFDINTHEINKTEYFIMFF